MKRYEQPIKMAAEARNIDSEAMAAMSRLTSLMAHADRAFAPADRPH
jgi:hypothetical protein